MVTVAPGIAAPLAFRTMPLIVPSVACPDDGAVQKEQRMSATQTGRITVRGWNM